MISSTNPDFEAKAKEVIDKFYAWGSLGTHKRCGAHIAQALHEAFEAGQKDAWSEINHWRPYLHGCPEWDGLIIDKGDPEFEVCHCFALSTE